MRLTLVKGVRLSLCGEPKLEFQLTRYPYLMSDIRQIKLLSTYEKEFLKFMLFFLNTLKKYLTLGLKIASTNAHANRNFK